jgi:hypothetical protein
LRLCAHVLPYIILLNLFARGILYILGAKLDAWAFVGIAIALASMIVFAVALGITVGIAIGINGGVAIAIAVGIGGLGEGIIAGLAVGAAVGATLGTVIWLYGEIPEVFTIGAAGVGGGIAGGVIGGVTIGITGGIVGGIACTFFYLRLYYLAIHLFWLWPRLRPELYRFHPVAWDDLCRLPFPGVDRLLVAVAEFDLQAGTKEIERLIDEYPSQRSAALRARAILVTRGAAATENLARLDEVLRELPEGTKGFLQQTPELRRRVHEITALQARLDTVDRPFLREPFAALLVKEIETFGHQIAGFLPPLSTEFRKAARRWMVVAQRQLATAQAATSREPKRQVFRAGDPVNREQEAFVPRASILGELERQVTLSTGCPGLLLYGRRRMGKSTLLGNLNDFLPPRVLVVRISMQQAHAFASLPDLLGLICQQMRTVVTDLPSSPGNLKEFEAFLEAAHQRLDASDRRLLLAIDEYENLDQKIGEGVFSTDLIAVVRESIQRHRRLIWTFAGSHAIDELPNAPWTSYLVSVRTLEVIPFELKETRLLLTEPLAHSTLWKNLESDRPRFEPGFWGEGGIERIHDETGGWPHLVQLVAENLVDLVNDSDGAAIDAALFERALDRAVVRGNNVFLELLERESRLPGEWDYLLSFRKAQDRPAPADEAVARSLRRRLLIREEGDRCSLRVPLMGRWLRQRA